MNRLILTLGFVLVLLSPPIGSFAASPDLVERVAAYSPEVDDRGVAYVDGKVPTLFHFYMDSQPDITKSRAEAPHVYTRIDVTFKDGDLVPSKPVPIKKKDIGTLFSDVDDLVGDTEERAAKNGDSKDEYSLFEAVKIDDETTIDVTIGPSSVARFMSHLVVHHKGRTESYNYYSIIRRVFPIPMAGPKIYMGVIADNCGNSGCTSTVEILRLVATASE